MIPSIIRLITLMMLTQRERLRDVLGWKYVAGFDDNGSFQIGAQRDGRASENRLGRQDL